MAQNLDAAGNHESSHESSAWFYVFIALVLGAITYVEFSLVEHGDTWLGILGSSGNILWTLIVLSVIKFVLVVMFFMHLAQDSKTYTGFFMSGMAFAVFVLLGLVGLFTVHSVKNNSEAERQAAQIAQGGVGASPNASAEFPAPSGNTNAAAGAAAPAAGGSANLGDPLAQPAAGGEAAGGGGDAAAGEALFVGQYGCAGCHGQDATGGMGPNLTDSEWKYGGDEAAITETIANGRPGGMPAFSAQGASPEDVANLTAFVLSLSGEGKGAAPAGGAPKAAPAEQPNAAPAAPAAPPKPAKPATPSAAAAPPKAASTPAEKPAADSAKAPASATQPAPAAPAAQAGGKAAGSAEAGSEGDATGDPEAGQALFVGQLGCYGCHGRDGGGGMGPSLADKTWIYGGDQATIVESITNGRPGGMPAFGTQVSGPEIANVAAFVMSLSK